jgi:hypothetical protein
MDFRLTYHGSLPPASGRNKRTADKHRIRKELHPQLKRLWQVHPLLKGLQTNGPGITPVPMPEMQAGTFRVGVFNFVPPGNEAVTSYL